MHVGKQAVVNRHKQRSTECKDVFPLTGHAVPELYLNLKKFRAVYICPPPHSRSGSCHAIGTNRKVLVGFTSGVDLTSSEIHFPKVYGGNLWFF